MGGAGAKPQGFVSVGRGCFFFGGDHYPPEV